MKAMARICAPCRLSLQCSLHASTTCLNNADTSTTPQNKSSAPHQEMDFMKATEILFSEDKSNRRKKFGWDFHLWQAFVACLPSVAIYLTAQYARHDMKKVKAKIEEIEAEKLKIEEQKQEQEARKAPGFQMLEDRLDKMEEKIGKIELLAAQTKPAPTAENQTEQVKKYKDNVKAGEADMEVQAIKDAKAPGNAAQNIPVKEETKETKKDHVKAHEREPEKGDTLAASKAASGENVNDGHNIFK